MKHNIIWKKIVKDIAGGMTDPELIKKYNLSENQLISIFRQLAKLRERRIKMLGDDLNSGMDHSELMKKYGLSTEGLETALKLLVNENAVSRDEFGTPSPFRGEERTVRDSRGTPRSQPIPVVTICELGKPETRYLVRDISEKGIGVNGIRAQIDEIRSLAVVGDEFGEIAPFELEGQCRWAKRLDPDGPICAGFRITKIAEQDALRLREFIQGFTFGID
jgi:Mor family transcriptional regulator